MMVTHLFTHEVDTRFLLKPSATNEDNNRNRVQEVHSARVQIADSDIR